MSRHYGHGNFVVKTAHDLGINIRLVTNGSPPTFPPKEITIVVKNPSQELCKKFLDKWTTASDELINEASICLEVSYKDWKGLFTGDSNGTKLGIQNQKYNYVDVPHHGSKNNINPDFVTHTNSDLYVISTNGARFHHPDDEAIKALKDKKILATYIRPNLPANAITLAPTYKCACVKFDGTIFQFKNISDCFD